jgi:predicted permease
MLAGDYGAAEGPVWTSESVNCEPKAKPVCVIGPAFVGRLARRWRSARLAKEAAQSALFEMLAPAGLGLLAPVFDGYFTCAETALGRPLATGCGLRLSADEACLAALLMRPSMPCAAATPLFASAVRSARIMVANVTA